MKNEVEIVDSDIVDLTERPQTSGLLEANTDNILYLADKADKYIDAMNRIMDAALKITSELDWVLIGGKPYLQESGATKVARLFGISIQLIGTPTVRSWKVEVKGGIITGREDIRIKDENGELLPVEIKGLSPFEFDKLNSVNDFLKSKRAYVRGYPAQLFVYMLRFGKEKGYFALTNKLTGETKFIEVPFDYEFGEQMLSKAERIYAALESETPPDACDDISLCENCSLAHICGQCRRVPADVDLDDELDELINRKQALSEAKKEYEQVDKEIKARIGEREKVITGQYLIERKSFVKKAFTVPESKQWRINIKRL